MKIIIHGTKGGYRILYSSSESPNSVAGDVRPATSFESAVGKSAYSISFTIGGYVLSKYIIVRDMIRSMATGNIAFSVYFPSNEKLTGSDAKALLDQLSAEYHKRYLPEDNLGNKHENWDFVTLISSEFKSKPNTDADEAIKFHESSTDAAYVYYSTNEELLKYLETPYQDEYFEGRFRQIFLVDKELDGKPQNPLKALKHNPSANLTGKIDLDNPKYKLLFNETAKGGIKIEVKINGNRRSNKNKVRRKDIIEISYTKQYYQPIIVPPGRWTEIASEFIAIDDVTESISIEEVELKPIEKEIFFETVDKKGIPVIDIELTCQNNFSNEIRKVTNNKLIFRGEELKERWTVNAIKKNMFVQPIPFTPEIEGYTITLTLQELKKVKFQIYDEEVLVPGCNIQVGNKSTRNDNDEIEFIGDEIFSDLKIQISRYGYVTYSSEFCPAKSEETHKLKLNKKPERTFISQGIDDTRDLGIDETRIRLDDKNASWFRRNRKSILWTLISVFGVWTILIVSYIFLLRPNDTKTEDSNRNDSRIARYIQGPDLKSDTLDYLDDIYCGNTPNTNENKNFINKILSRKNTNSVQQTSPEYCAILDSAISLRKLINDKDFTDLKTHIYSGLYHPFVELLRNTEDSLLADFSVRLADYQLDDLSLDSITKIITNLEINESQSPKRKTSENVQSKNSKKPSGLDSKDGVRTGNTFKEKPKVNVKSELQIELEEYLKGDDISFIQLQVYQKRLQEEKNPDKNIKACIDLTLKIWELDGDPDNSYSWMWVQIERQNIYSCLKDSSLKEFLNKMKELGDRNVGNGPRPKYWSELGGIMALGDNKTLKKLTSQK